VIVNFGEKTKTWQDQHTPEQWEKIYARRKEIVRRKDAGETATSIAKSLGISRERVHQIYWKQKRGIYDANIRKLD